MISRSTYSIQVFFYRHHQNVSRPRLRATLRPARRRLGGALPPGLPATAPTSQVSPRHGRARSGRHPARLPPRPPRSARRGRTLDHPTVASRRARRGTAPRSWRRPSTITSPTASGITASRTSATRATPTPCCRRCTCRTFRDEGSWKNYNAKHPENPLTWRASCSSRSPQNAHGLYSPKRFIARLKRDNELFRSFMHQDAHAHRVGQPAPLAAMVRPASAGAAGPAAETDDDATNHRAP